MTDEQLAAIRERCEAATPGPFDIYVHGDNAGYTVAKFDDNGEDVFWTFSKKDDAEFIAAARTDVPALLDEVERQRMDLGLFRSENDDLRVENERLRAKVCELEDIPTCPVCGEPMTRRNADGTLGCNLCYALDGDA